jgi:myo-inositol-1(or 4)-monophosphatase
MALAGREAALPLLGTAAGRAALSRGAGGDLTVELDRAAEDAILRILAANAPAPYTVISEEAGSSDSTEPRGASSAEPDWRVLVDPVDGSLNAKRGLEPCCAAIAVADGPELSHVRVALVHDYSRGHVFAAIRGAGLRTSRQVEGLEGAAPIEVVLLEAGKPDGHSFGYRDLAMLAGGAGSTELRVRQIGSLALSLCHVATGAADVLLAPVPSRAVDIAASLLMLTEAGGGFTSLDGTDMLRQPLDLERRAAFVAWRRGLDGPAVADRARRLFGR